MCLWCHCQHLAFGCCQDLFVPVHKRFALDHDEVCSVEVDGESVRHNQLFTSTDWSPADGLGQFHTMVYTQSTPVSSEFVTEELDITWFTVTGGPMSGSLAVPSSWLVSPSFV